MPGSLSTRVSTDLEVDPSADGLRSLAGGDIVSGTATVILAMGQGKIAAKAIHEYLETGEWVSPETAA